MRNIIVGSGPAAAGVALALAEISSNEIVVIDIGERLDAETQRTVSSVKMQSPDAWSIRDRATLAHQPEKAKGGKLPQKRVFGSDFPFRNSGQLDGITYGSEVNESPVSAAFGGFSNVWGAQAMPFSRATFDDWPVSFDEMAPHYEAVLKEVPLAAEHDDYAAHFPLLSDRAQPLPPLSARSSEVLSRYQAHREELQAMGITAGRARLAFQADECVSCGLCMTGCPYGYIYSASMTFDRLIGTARITYRGGSLATRVSQSADSCSVAIRSVSTGVTETIEGDRVFVACGGIGTTRLILGSMQDPPKTLDLQESVQFVMPFLSLHSTGDPRNEANSFTLNQFNLLVSLDDDAYQTSQVHCYPYNPAMLDALPAILGTKVASRITGAMLGRLTVGLGYLPSWASPRVALSVDARGDGLADLKIERKDLEAPLMLKVVTDRLAAAGKLLDLRPLSPAVELSGAAKSYHFGGSFAPARPGMPRLTHNTDRLGRIAEWSRIHLVDGSVFSNAPSTTFTLTAMANAHRIASEAISNG